MTARVLDASVAVAWYLPESFSTPARRWRALLAEGKVQMLVPSLHFWEVANVLRTYVRRSEIPAALAEDIYETHLQAPLSLVEPDRHAVLRVAFEYDATAYDATYIAISLDHGIVLLTGERRSVPWVTRLGPLAECLTDPGYTVSGSDEQSAGEPWLHEVEAPYGGRGRRPARIFGSPLKDALDELIKQAVRETGGSRSGRTGLPVAVRQHLLAVLPSGQTRLVGLLSERLPEWRDLTSAVDKERYISQKLRYRIGRHLPRLLRELA